MNIGCGMLNPVAWNSLNNSSATLASASAEGFRGPILFITLEAYLAVECNTQDCLNINKSYIQQSFMIENDVCVRGQKKRHVPVRRYTSMPWLTTITKGPTQRIRIVERETMNGYLIKTELCREVNTFEKVAGP